MPLDQMTAAIYAAQKEKGLDETSYVKNVTITGWEPLIQQKKIEEWMRANPDFVVQIETNGTIMPSEYLLQHAKFNCSPKLLSSWNEWKAAYRENVLKAISGTNAPCFKFVVTTKEDIDEVLRVYACIPKHQIYIMPEWVTKEENTAVYDATIDYIIEKWLNTTPRLQNIAFDWAKRWV